MNLYDCINFKLTHAQNAVSLYFKQELYEFDITPIQYALLDCLWDNDGQMPSQLAQSMHFDSSTVTGLVSRLEDKGLVLRSFCTVDRRRVMVCLTEKGKQLEAPVRKKIDACNDKLFASFTPDEIQVLASQLNELIATAQELT